MAEKKKEIQGPKSSWLTIVALTSAALLGGYKYYNSTPKVPVVFEEPLESLAEGLCPINESIRPLDYQKNNATVEHIINDPQFRVKAAARLTGAVKIPTVTNDEIGDLEEDPEDWKIFYKMHDYLKETFPLVHEHLKVETVNRYSLVFTWEGQDESLKPLLLTAHQDVVPVAEKTWEDWEHGPFDGYFDGEKLWGRGASDDKNMMIAILSAIETLLEEGYTTKRTVVIGLGHDEEIGGARGAAFIAKFLEERYGKESFYALIDEGTGLSMIGGRIFAIPSVGEKGATTLYISLTTPGGHSSVPPKHTSIGLVSKVITLIEDNPFPAELTAKSPALGMLQCIARHSEKLPESLRRNVFKAAYDKIANAKVLAFMATKPVYDTFVRTTQAIDVINGGVTSNALPEFVSFVINTRINAGSSVQDVIDKIVGNIREVAEEHNFGIYLGDEEILPKTKAGYFKIEWDRKLEPAPISPMDDETWDIFAGSVKHIVDDYAYPELPPSVVTGNLLMGNTDTNRYWNLTNHIYRFEMTTYTMKEGIHSLNEYVVFNDHLYEIAFIYEYIKNINDFSKSK